MIINILKSIIKINLELFNTLLLLLFWWLGDVMADAYFAMFGKKKPLINEELSLDELKKYVWKDME